MTQSKQQDGYGKALEDSAANRALDPLRDIGAWAGRGLNAIGIPIYKPTERQKQREAQRNGKD